MILLESPSDTALWAVGRMLRDFYGYSLRVHRPGPLGWQTLTARLADAHCRVCYLRSHLSDAVDARLTHRRMEECAPELRTLELAMLSLAAQVIVVQPEAVTDAQLPLSWTAAGTLRVERAYGEGFEQLPWRTRLPVSRWREGHVITRGRFSKRFQRALDSQMRREVTAMRWLPPSLGVGSVDPAFLVIGEAPTGSPCRHTAEGDLPDLPFSRGPASELLWQATDEIGLRWWEGYWMNAATCQAGTGWTSASVPIPRAGRILSLGEAAEALVYAWYGEEGAHLLAQAGVWRVVAHPSHVMRFRARDYPRWRDEIGHFLASSLEVVDDVLGRDPDTSLGLGL